MTEFKDSDAGQNSAFPVQEASEPGSGSRPAGGAASRTGRKRTKPTIAHTRRPLTRETLPQFVAVEAEADGADGADNSRSSGAEALDADVVDTAAVKAEAEAGTAKAEHLQSLWDHGTLESAQLAAKLRSVAAYWPVVPDTDHDLRDEAEYLIAQALRTSINHASRLLHDAHKATTHLPRLLDLLEHGQLPGRWFTFVLRRSSDLNEAKLADLDASIADWDLRVEEDRFSRQLSALVRWLRDQQEVAAPTPPQRSVEVSVPDEDGTACLQVHGPAPEILALGRRLDSAASAVQQAQRQALENGEELPFDDGTAAEQGWALPRSRLRYEVLTRSILDTGGIAVPKERFRINVTVPALTLLGVENGPGLLDGIHPIPAEMARELAGQASVWYRVLTDPTRGAFLPLPATRYTPTPEMLEYLRLVFPVCAVPGCTRPTSWASQMDHIEEYHHHTPEKGGKTEIPNLHPLCWRHHQMKTARILDPVKESISHAVTAATKDSAPAVTSAPHQGDTTPGAESPESELPDRECPDRELPDRLARTVPRGGEPPPGTPPRDMTPAMERDMSSRPETVTGFKPGVTHWTIRGSTPRRVEDECDLITPWLVRSFATLWKQTQERLAAHRAAAETPTRDDRTVNAPDPEPPPF